MTSITKADKKADELKCNFGIKSLSKGYNTTHTAKASISLARMNIYEELIPGNCEKAAPNLAKIRAITVMNSTDVSTSIFILYTKIFPRYTPSQTRHTELNGKVQHLLLIPTTGYHRTKVILRI